MADYDGPNYGFDTSSTTINLKTFQSKPKYAHLPTDYDHARLLGPFDPGVFLADSAPSADQVTHKKPSVFSSFRPGFFNRDRAQYTRFGSSDNVTSAPHPHFRSWRKAVFAAAGITGLVLLANTSFAVYALSRFGQDDGIGVLFTGDCERVKRLDTGLHLAINLLGTALLGASSFTMQCLTSPTRSEADQAHSKRVSLDIGISSFKNLFHLSWKKSALWWLLALTTVPLHLLWNSTVFSTLGANEFSYFVVDESFLQGAPYMTRYDNCDWYNPVSGERVAPPYQPSFESIYNSYQIGNFSNRMEVSDCIRSYATAFVSGKRHMIAVTSATSTTRMSPGCAFTNYRTNSSLFYYGPDYLQPLWNGSSVLAFEDEGTNVDQSWLCYGYEEYDIYGSVCDLSQALNHLNTNGTWYLRPYDDPYHDASDLQAYPIDYCLIEDRAPQYCTLQYVSYILFVVIGCNAVKVACMLTAAIKLWNLDEPILATVGDAIASYMDSPDPSTAGWCLLGRSQLHKWRKWKLGDPVPDIYEQPSKARLFSATSKTRWFVTMGLCTLYLGVGIALYFLSAPLAGGGSIARLAKLGFGAITSQAVLGVQGSTTGGLMNDVLIANAFQIALSTTYFLYNSLYTAQCAALEWASFASERRPLRVSYPRGKQMSSFYLQLPYIYGIPLTALLMLLHFLISQSIFLARVQWYDSNGNLDGQNFISDVGFSPLAIAVTLCVGGALILIQIGHAMRPLDATMPIHGNSSAIISAACHPTQATYTNSEGVLFYHSNDNMALRNIMWGVTVPAGTGVGHLGHCTFTAEKVELPTRGKRYH